MNQVIYFGLKNRLIGGSSTKLGLGGGQSYDHLQLQQTYTGGGQLKLLFTFKYTHSN